MQGLREGSSLEPPVLQPLTPVFGDENKRQLRNPVTRLNEASVQENQLLFTILQA